MESRRDRCFGPLLFLLYVNDFHSNIFDFHPFADGANLFYKNKPFSILETNINIELNNIHIWLCVNKLSLIIKNWTIGQCNSGVFIGLTIMGYELLYHALPIW